MIRAWVDRLVIGLGTAVLLLALLFVLEPAVLTPVLDPDTVETQLAETVGLLVISLTLLVGGSVAVWKGRTSGRPATDTLAVDPDQTADTDDSDSAILAFDAAVEAAIETGATSQRDAVTEQLRTVAVETIVVADDCAPETARESVRAGEWTDDRVVAAFLGGSSAPSAPLRWRLYAWLYDERAFRASVDRTLEAVERRQETSL